MTLDVEEDVFGLSASRVFSFLLAMESSELARQTVPLKSPPSNLEATRVASDSMGSLLVSASDGPSDVCWQLKGVQLCYDLLIDSPCEVPPAASLLWGLMTPSTEVKKMIPHREIVCVGNYAIYNGSKPLDSESTAGA